MLNWIGARNSKKISNQRTTDGTAPRTNHDAGLARKTIQIANHQKVRHETQALERRKFVLQALHVLLEGLFLQDAFLFGVFFGAPRNLAPMPTLKAKILQIRKMIPLVLVRNSWIRKQCLVIISLNFRRTTFGEFESRIQSLFDEFLRHKGVVLQK